MLYIFLKILFIYSWETDRERGRDTGRGRNRLQCRERDVGFDPGTPGSRPGPMAGSKPLNNPGIPICYILMKKFLEAKSVQKVGRQNTQILNEDRIHAVLLAPT